MFEGRETTIPAEELITNGSFESGDFTGWTLTNAPGAAWTVVAGTQDGAFLARNPFDAEAGEFTLFQDISIPPGMLLNLFWVDRVFSDIFGALPRTHEVQVRDPNTNAVLATLFSLSTTPFIFDTGFVAHAADLSSFAGSTIRVFFVQTIPETFTGPGTFQIDAISTLGLPPGFTP